jgi:3-deoxy-7-phosphoheptulonate synthase/chorismate mutase
MVKQVFVFSDMQFDAAYYGTERWSTSFERIKTKFADAGYEVPRLVFWNLRSGKTDKPVLLKRGLSATIEEFIYAAEYIMASGNSQVILCERGIRTYERATRNTLDITAVPILKQETHLPVMVDVTHSTGRRDLLLPAAKAALAVGADGVMVEVHPNPAIALSDAQQQLDFDQFDQFVDGLTAQFPQLDLVKK